MIIEIGNLVRYSNDYYTSIGVVASIDGLDGSITIKWFDGTKHPMFIFDSHYFTEQNEGYSLEVLS